MRQKRRANMRAGWVNPGKPNCITRLLFTSYAELEAL